MFFRRHYLPLSTKLNTRLSSEVDQKKFIEVVFFIEAVSKYIEEKGYEGNELLFKEDVVYNIFVKITISNRKNGNLVSNRAYPEVNF